MSKVKSIEELTRGEREELNTLSKEVFGASSRWQKLIKKGSVELITEETTEYVPGEKEEDEPTTRKVQVPLKHHNGAYRSTVKYYTTDSVKEYMLKLKDQIEARKALLEKIKKEREAKLEKEKLTQKIQEELGGSATG